MALERYDKSCGGDGAPVGMTERKSRSLYDKEERGSEVCTRKRETRIE